MVKNKAEAKVRVFDVTEPKDVKKYSETLAKFKIHYIVSVCTRKDGTTFYRFKTVNKLSEIRRQLILKAVSQ